MTLTPEQQAAYQADVDAVIAGLGIPEACGKVREYPCWTDEETGEEFPSYWVAEVRIGRGASMAIAVVHIGEPEKDRSAWVDVLQDEVDHAAETWRRRR